MTPRYLLRSRSGFLLLETLIGISLFAIFVMAVGVSLLVSQDSAAASADRVRAIELTQTALEGARSMRDEGFSTLTTGDHGVKLGSGALGVRWMFDGQEIVTGDGYRTRLTIETIATDKLRLTAKTTWSHGKVRTGAVLLSTVVTNWQAVKQTGNWAAPVLRGEYVDAGTPLFNDIAVAGRYVFVSSEVSAGGRGLYVFDVINPASPVPVATSFNLGAAGYDLAIYGNTLYVLTSDDSQEIQAYDISAPASLSAGNLRTSYNLPGSARGRSMDVSSTTLVVGASESATESELYTFSIADSSAITLSDSENDVAAVEDLSVSGQYAYIGSAADISEIRVANIANPSTISLPAGSGYNLTDVLDGMAVGVSGTSAVLGRSNGAAIEELVMFDVQARPVPDPPPGPWYLEGGGSINALVVEPGEHYAFVASNLAGKQLRILNLWRWQNGGTAEQGYYATATGNGRGVYYDAWSDRAYLVTNSAFIIVSPS